MPDYCEFLKIAGAIIMPNLQGIVMARKDSTFSKSIKEWYPTLKFPSYKPPNYIFGPVWTSLYASMGYASYLVYKSGGGFNGDARLPLALYGTQLALNWAWSPIFFGCKQIGYASVEMTALIAAACATAYTFYKINPTAGYLMAPYLAWLAFAWNLNFQIWRLNKDQNAIKNE